MQNHHPVLLRSIRLGALGDVTVADAVVVGLMVGLVILAGWFVFRGVLA
jgi:hypothetical protein